MPFKNSLKKEVFFPPFIFLLIATAYSVIDQDGFLESAKSINNWILQHFDWLFSWSTFLFLLLLIFIYFSPLAKIRIGGKDAKPILTKWKWFAITLCTTVATGILFWGSAEPLFHLHQPPLGGGAASAEAKEFAMSTMFMHWTFTPYGIYTTAALLFALTYYNMKQPFSLASLLYPLIGKRAYGGIGVATDVICLFALVAGMAASLGTGILTLSGGLHKVFGLTESNFLTAIIALTIVCVFIASAASGLQKGIRLLSDINIRAFFVIAGFVLIFGPTMDMLKTGGIGLLDYFQNFFQRSTGIGSDIPDSWSHSWTVFYWANWMAWTPITALFLGRLGVGYTVRDFIHFNLVFPSIFGGFWMVIFSGAAMNLDLGGTEFPLYEILQAQGEQNVIFELFSKLPLSNIISMFFVLTIFISYVTAADSNTSAMSGISAKGINPENPEAPLLIKIAWGLMIGIVSYIMISFAGVDGIRMTSNLGGFPALFLVIFVAIGLVRMLLRREEMLGE
ncbi:MAG: BCCT family transporter [Bacteroidia bacterium]|nr:BCCT family transporter [Bacteroidia bacterium]